MPPDMIWGLSCPLMQAQVPSLPAEPRVVGHCRKCWGPELGGWAPSTLERGLTLETLLGNSVRSSLWLVITSKNLTPV